MTELIEQPKTGAGFNRGGSRQDFETPDDFIEAVRSRFGPIWADLAADDANKKAESWLSEAVDALRYKWYRYPGLLWLNPPFSKIEPWAKKCAEEYLLGAKILFLTPASVGSNWFASYVHEKALVLFLSPRLRFVGTKDPYPKDLILSCYGFGVGYEPWRWKP